jgi:hypothetical protein
MEGVRSSSEEESRTDPRVIVFLGNILRIAAATRCLANEHYRSPARTASLVRAASAARRVLCANRTAHPTGTHKAEAILFQGRRIGRQELEKSIGQTG